MHAKKAGSTLRKYNTGIHVPYIRFAVGDDGLERMTLAAELRSIQNALLPYGSHSNRTAMFEVIGSHEQG